jgi:hypothetical protein
MSFIHTWTERGTFEALQLVSSDILGVLFLLEILLSLFVCRVEGVVELFSSRLGVDFTFGMIESKMMRKDGTELE